LGHILTLWHNLTGGIDLEPGTGVQFEFLKRNKNFIV